MNKMLGLIALTILLLAGGANAATLTVNANGGANYTKIQDAINAASAGDTVLVYSGTYYEVVFISKQLELIGQDSGGGLPVINGLGMGDAISVRAGGVIIDGFNVITVGTHDGIKVTSNNNMLKNNILSNNNLGILLSSSNNNTLIGNTASNNGGGIMMDHSSNNYLNGNTANSNNNDGIYIISGSNNNTLIGNTASNNDGHGIMLQSMNNILSGNNANSNGEHGIVLSTSGCWNNILSGNNANSNNNDGIYLVYSSYNYLKGNTASNNNNGFYLSSSNNELSSNILNSNHNYGIYITSSTKNTISNNIFNNANNAYADTPNIWNTTKIAGKNIAGGSYLGGNVWAKPDGTGFSQTCADKDRDGICDSSYVLDVINIEYLPLAYYTSTTTPTPSSTPIPTTPIQTPTPIPTVTPSITPTITLTSIPTVTPTLTPTKTPTPTSTSQLEPEVKELKERLNKTEEIQRQQESRISWLESTINSIIDWFKSIF